MSCSPALKWFLILLLPFTLAWKLAVRPGDAEEPRQLAGYREIANFLVRQHFVVKLSEQVSEGRPSIHASAGACRVLVARSNPVAWERDVIRQYATDGDHVFYVLRGRVYAEQPNWLMVYDSLWTRFRRELGLKTQTAPVLAVIAAPTCDAERLPWHELV